MSANRDVNRGERETKLDIIRASLRANGASAARLRGVDWFAWATCGGSSMVILTTETGVGEILITQDRAWILTDSIEAERLDAEENPQDLDIWSAPWNDPAAR